MSTLELRRGVLNIVTHPSTRTLTFTFYDSAGAARNMSGSWLCKVRPSVESDTTSMTLTVGDASAASGIITVSLVEATCQALITDLSTKWVGWWDLEKDTVVELGGTFTLDEKATRA